MPTSVIVNHFPLNFLDVLIGGFYSSIHLRMISGWVPMSNLKLLTYDSHQVTVKICTIISNDGFWYPNPTYQIVANEINYNFLGYRLIRSWFHPFGEVINSNQDKYVLEAAGSIGPMTSMPKATNGQGELITLSSWGGTRIKSSCTWHLWHFCTKFQQ